MANRFYIGTGVWNDTARWSTTSGGSSGASVPGASDTPFFDGNSGNCTLDIDVTVGGNGFDFTNYAAIFSGNGHTINCFSFYNPSGTTKTFDLTNCTLNLTGQWNMQSVTGLTVVTTGSTFNMSYTDPTFNCFIGGGKTYNVVNLTATSGIQTVTGNNTYATLNLNGSNKTVQFASSSTQTITSSFIARGTSGNLITIQSNSGGTAFTLSKASGTVACDYLSVQDSHAGGGAAWYAGANSTNVSGNTGWLFTAAVYTLTATVGTFTLTGINASFSHVRTLTAGFGSFVLTGFPLNIIPDTTLYQDFGGIDGTKYQVSLYVGGDTGNITVTLGTGDSKVFSAGTGQNIFTGVYRDAPGLYIFPSSDFNGYIDNVSVYELSLGSGTKGSYEWETSTGDEFSLRSYGKYLEFDWNSVYNQLLTNLSSPYVEFTKVLDFAEQIDVLLFVYGDKNIHRWSGGVSKVRTSTATTLTKQGVLTDTSFAFVSGSPATITDVNNNFLNAGFTVGDSLYVIGSSNNSRIFTISSVTAGIITLATSDIIVSEVAGPSITLHTGEPTWKSSRFFSTISGRAITYNGISYTYGGGEGTDTLTGLTAFPIVAVGDSVWQTPDTITLPSSITSPFPDFAPNLIGTQINQVVLESTTSQMVFGSASDDYTNFTLTTPRAPGDPFQTPLTSGRATCLIPIDTTNQILNIQSNFAFGSGQDTFDKVDFHMSADNTEELLRIVRYKTARGAGIISKSAFTPVKNATLYISREPAFDAIGNVETPEGRKDVPISDLIKNDFDNYDFTDAHVVYWKRSAYIALPTEGIVLVYDLMRSLWQPPQTIPVGRLAIIGDWLYGHSTVTNETYKLFSGTNDNGIFISQRARMAYNNGGTPGRIKNASQYWSDGYITANALLKMMMNFGFDGIEGKKVLSILGNDSSITNPVGASILGDEQLGANPLGGATLDTSAAISGMVRFWQEDTMDTIDYNEHYVEYAMDTLDGQFALVRHGSNQQDAETSPVTHKK